MKYPGTFTADPDGGYVITFRDIPEAITQGDTEEEAMFMAQDVLLEAMSVYFDEKRVVPSPSKLRRGERFIELPLSVSAKILLLNEMLNQQIQPVELARRLDTTRQEVNRLIDLGHTTKIDRIGAAMAELGKHLELVAA